MHNHDDKYPNRPGFEPVTPRLQAPVDTKEPSGPAVRVLWSMVLNAADKSSEVKAVTWP